MSEVKDLKVYDLEGNKVGEYASAKEIHEALGIPMVSIYAVAVKGSRRKSTYGYQIKRGDDLPEDLSESNTDSKKPKKVYHYSKDGSKLLNVYSSTLEASKKLKDITQSGVSSICYRDKLTGTTKYNLRFEGDAPKNLLWENKYTAFNLKGDKVVEEFESIEDVYKKYPEFKDKKSKKKFISAEDKVQIIRNKYIEGEVKPEFIYMVTDTNKNTSKNYKTLQEVGDEYGVSRERVRQIVNTGGKISGKYTVKKINS